MKLFREIVDLKEQLKQDRASGKSIGFVPTMGALHEGHLTLVREAGEHSDIVVVSVFVNPTQFNDPGDLERYPRDLDTDMEKLETTPCKYVFSPSVKEMYPEKDERIFNFGALENVMEGEFRPGHFNGVAQVVSKLFDIVEPDKAFFGMKDFQQVAVIKAMVKQLNSKVEIVPCDTVRESDGVAMSSRNNLLTSEHRDVAPLINKTLKEARNLIPERSVEEVKEWVVSQVNANPLLEVEYFEIVNDEDLQPVNAWNSGCTVGCIAVFAGEIRLIDNIIF
ncbi:pantoate--beta-alanine ligase [Puteibacter caeruleilacunae]|nr:pantoate--beta-alanine ligase [Puteibacter caeruleilacunae]